MDDFKGFNPMAAFKFGSSFLYILCLTTLTFISPLKAESKWKTVSHQKSKLTIVSDLFAVKIIRQRDGMSSITEIATLTQDFEVSGFVVLNKLTTTSYCGFKSEVKDSYLKTGGFLNKYIGRSGGGSVNSIKSHKVRLGGFHDGHYGRVIVTEGERSRCSVMSAFVRHPSDGDCGAFMGTEILAGALCQPKAKISESEIKSMLIGLIENTKTSGTEKSKIIPKSKLKKVKEEAESLAKEVPNSKINQANTNGNSMKKAKDECSEIGYKKGTEKFADCVMKLLK